MTKFAGISFIFFLFFFLSCRTPEVRRENAWKDKSQTMVDAYARDLGVLFPEATSDIGYEEFDEMVTPFSSSLLKKNEDLFHRWQKRLKSNLEDPMDPELATDVRILLNEINLELEGISFDRKFGVIPFIPFTEFVFQNLKDSFGERGDLNGKRKALIRFKKYVHGGKEFPPLSIGLKEYINSSISFVQFPLSQAYWPSRYELENYLQHSRKFISAIKDLLSHFDQKEWADDFQQLQEQDESFKKYIKEAFLPFVGKKYPHLEDVFNFKLKKLGVDIPVDQLIQMAKEDYRKTFLEFKRRGRELAKKHHLKNSNHLEVIRFLMSRSYDSQENLLLAFEKMNDLLFKIIQEHDLISIKVPPKFIFRFASEAEVQSTPAPFFISPPLLDKKGNKRGQFVITPPSSERLDFSYPEAILSLTAHETMPGHGLQYHVMKERGTTLVRSWLAFNSVNVEGWGLYAEDLVFPYVSEEAKFILLQRRLWRQARMFLDPELNLGRITKDRVFQVFQNELGFSRPFAQSEFDRYFYIMPGQATTYFFGYRKLLELKSLLRKKLKTHFSEKCFNDAVLNLGVLPLSEVHLRLINSLTCRDST
jgi:hypothetical protein